jgi:hypothetical protein
MALEGSDLFVGNLGGKSVTEVDVSTGSLVRVFLGTKYRLSEPGAQRATGGIGDSLSLAFLTHT